MSTKRFLLVFSFVFSEFIFGQENIIFSNDQYSGINSAVVSPTQPFLNPNPWDANLFSENIFLQNNYGYVSQQSLLGLGNAEIKSVSIKNNITGENTANVFDFYNNDFGTYHFSSDIMGPSLNLKFKIKEKDFSVGLFSRLRTQSSAIKLDNYLRYSNQSIAEPENYLLNPLKLNVMNWAEFGFNFSTAIFPYSDYQWLVGANLKYEMGLDAVNVNSRSTLNLKRTEETTSGVTKETITASNYDIEASFATNYNFDANRYELKQKGKGLGLDFGIAMVDRNKNSDDYNLKIAFNVLDIGKVNFAGETHLLKGNPIKVTNNPNLDNVKIDNPQELMRLLSKEVYGNENQSFQGTDFTIGLPTSLHFNFSKNVGVQQYFNANLIQRIPIFENALRRSNIFNVSYSVQKPTKGYGASVSLYEYRNLQFGGYFRIGPFILGSENVFPLFFKHKKLHAGDLYIAIKLYPFWDNEMKRHRRKNCNCD